MSETVSAVIPVKDGARHLPELLAALDREGVDEVLVVDSGSADGSAGIAGAAGATVVEIDPATFKHGPTRNLAAEAARGDVLAFLTQDATPVPGWLDALREGLALAPHVGAVFGPHLPREDTSPMIARELTDFFAEFAAPDGGPRLFGPADPPWLSNVNAAYRRACWAEIRFRDVAYAEDQAFARALTSSRRWRRAYHPGAGVLHAHDYPPLEFMRRYFDEYRGLREATGHVERIGVRSTVRDVRGLVAADRRWMDARGVTAGERARWTARSVTHHTGRKLFSALGSQALALPAPVQRAISLEGRAAVTAPAEGTGPKPTAPVAAGGPGVYAPVLELLRDGAAPLLAPVPGMADAEALHVAVVIPPFRRGSGGHSTIYNLLTRLEDRGHTVSTWVHDTTGLMREFGPDVIRGQLVEYFRPIRGPVFKGFADWYGADVVLATGWDTVFPALRLPDCRARTYLVQDHEPEFNATSAESLFAAQSYGLGLHAIAASPWLADLAREHYGGSASHFDLGVDHAVYRPRDVVRRRDTVIFYSRNVTPRRGVPLGMLALEELRRRRPDLRFVLFGDDKPTDAPFPYEHLGIATPEQLAWAYSEATVGLSLSLTNYSLIPQEMLACGLPCVELAGRSLEGVFGADGPVTLTTANPVDLADALERLLEDDGRWERRSREGIEFVGGRTWEHAADQVEAALRDALRERERDHDAPPGEGPARRPADAAAVLGPSAATTAHVRTVPVATPATREASDRLFSRLSDEDVEEVERRLSGSHLAAWRQADESERRMLALVLGVWHGVEATWAKTGLRPDDPPEDVHAMARGPLASGGSIYYADMLADALRRVGAGMDDVRRGLDFGCSSGRVVRALAAAWPDAEWHGADPNARAVGWAREHLPGIAFLHSPQDPPLPYDDEAFDFACAISIWSHFGERAAVAWLEELRRIVRPGGHLILTAHGLQSVAHYAGTGKFSVEELHRVRRSLYRDGFWFGADFGEAGDWGVRHPEWGTSFLTPEWLARVACPQWSIEDLAVGENASNQDLYVLRRR